MVEMSDYQKYIHTSRYARWLDHEERRETWDETVDRYGRFFYNRLPLNPSGYAPKKLEKEYQSAIEMVRRMDIMPSMRCMMTAGKALERDEVSGYNCAFRAVDDIKAFDEMMYVLMCGTGVGFSVERQFIAALPEVAEEFHKSGTTIVVPDSKIGWASSYRELISLLFGGKIPRWDMSKIRPAGSRLKTFGGRASGPEPLEELFNFTVEVFTNAKGRKLTSLECHDLACKVADVVVVGGVRRSALISLSNLTDERMRGAKMGAWWETDPQRALANNSVCYTEKPDLHIFMKEWGALYESKSGERGMFSREAAKKTVERNGRRDSSHEFGTNPCSEILLRSKQFCNLSEVVVRPTDTHNDLKEKVRMATILGTLQATLTNFRYLSRKWKTNTEEEALLGVSLTGIMDHPFLCGRDALKDPEMRRKLATALEELRDVAIETNREWADKLGINPSTAITCVKPSGTVSQLVNSSSGIHPRYSPYYIRTVRTDKKDPLYQFMMEQGIPTEDAIGKESSTAIFSFPIESPKASVMRDEMGAIEQLELWRIYAEHWCEHKPSITVYYSDEEYLSVGAWVYEHFENISGISFLPRSNHVYKQAPYTECSEAEYKDFVAKSPASIKWGDLSAFETGDTTSVEPELACTAGGCEIL